jgi:hypothetical protein
MKSALFRLSLILLLLMVAGCEHRQQVTLSVDQAMAVVDVAATEDARAEGLMHRQALAKDEGMLFIFPRDEILKLWMLNVHMPLDVGFFDREGRLIHFLTMQPDGGKTIYRSTAPARYALEMNQGWFSRNRLSKGAQMQISRKLKNITVN